VLGYAGYALVRDPLVLVVIGSTALALAALCFSQLFAHARERFAPLHASGNAAAFQMSLVRVCFSLAWTAGPAIGAWMMMEHGFRGLFLGAAALFFVFLIGVARYVPFERRPPELRAAIREPVWRVVTRGDVFAVFVAFLLVFAAHAMNTMNLPFMLLTVLGASRIEFGITYGIGPVSEIPLMLWFGYLAGRGHQLALIRVGAAATLVYFMLLPLAQAPWQVFPVMILSGVSYAILTNVAILFFQDLVPGQPGLATTVFTNAVNLGNLLGYFGFGLLVQPLGHRGMFLASAALTTVTVLILLAYRPRPPTVPM
jgi:MFS transporter, SET family, sugar efflux transporter